MIAIVLDTNIFYELQGIHNVPWEKLSKSAQVQLIVPSDVIRELDSHKDSPRLGERARRALRTLQDAAINGPIKIKPQVLLQVSSGIHAPWLVPTLNPLLADHRILNSALNLRKQFSNLVIATRDVAMSIEASMLGLSTLEIPRNYDRDRSDIEKDSKLQQKLKEDQRILSLSIGSHSKDAPNIINDGAKVPFRSVLDFAIQNNADFSARNVFVTIISDCWQHDLERAITEARDSNRRANSTFPGWTWDYEPPMMPGQSPIYALDATMDTDERIIKIVVPFVLPRSSFWLLRLDVEESFHDENVEIQYTVSAESPVVSEKGSVTMTATGLGP